MTTHRTPTRDTSDSREAPAAQADPAQELSDARDAAEWRQIGVEVYVRMLSEATRQIALLKGAIAAQDERERRAGEICDAVAEEVIVLRQQLAEVTATERREFAWAEEYMAKSRALELKLGAAEQQIVRLTQQNEKLLEEAATCMEFGSNHDLIAELVATREQIATLTQERDALRLAISRELTDHTAIVALAEAHRQDSEDVDACVGDDAAADPSKWSHSAQIDGLCSHLEDARAQIATLIEALTDSERIAQMFHDAYERLAPSFGYETRRESRKPWADVPEQNKQLMIAVAREVGIALAAVRGEPKP